MPKRASRLIFVFVIIVLLGIIGHNVYQRFLDSRLIAAIRQNDVTAVRTLLERGADPASYQPKSREPMTDTPALAFVITGSFASPEQQKIACLLIQHGALAHVDAKTLNTYLLNACAGGSAATVRCLLEHGAKATDDFHSKVTDQHGTDLSAVAKAMASRRGYAPNIANRKFWTAQELAQYEIAIKQHGAASQETICVLEEHGARLNAWQAAALDDVPALRAALDAGANIEAKEGERGNTMLWMAAEAGSLNAVRLLLDRGANLNASAMPHYDSVLSSAIINKNLDIARLLLQRGADPNGHGTVQKDPGAAPLVVACSFLPQLVPELLQRGADVKTAGGYALAAAMNNKHAELVTLLLKQGANCRGKAGYAVLSAAIAYQPDLVPQILAQGSLTRETLTQGNTLISQCVRYGRKELIVLLYRAGADVNGTVLLQSRSQSANSPMFYTTPLIEAFTQKPDLMALLLDQGADPNKPNSQGEAPLTLAAQTGNVAATKLLLKHGAKVNVVGTTRHTPLYFARRHKYPDVVALLEKAGGKEE